MANEKPSNQSRIWLKRLIREVSLCWLYQADLDNDWDLNPHSLRLLIELFNREISREVIEDEHISLKKVYNFFLLNNQVKNDEHTAKKLFASLPKLPRAYITAEFILNPDKGIEISQLSQPEVKEEANEGEETPRPLTQEELLFIILEEMFMTEVPKYLKVIIQHRNELDEEISSFSNNWALERMNCIDRNILRLAVGEIRHFNQPTKVIINEALEISKDYSQNESFKFINGILGRLCCAND